MAENNFSQLMKSFIIIILFSAILLFITVSLAGNYDTDPTQIEEVVGSEAITDSLESIAGNTTTWKTTFENWGTEGAFKNFLDVIGFFAVGIFNLLKSMGSFILFPFNLFGGIMVNVLHIPVAVVSIIGTLIFITIILGVWRLVKTGQ